MRMLKPSSPSSCRSMVRSLPPAFLPLTLPPLFSLHSYTGHPPRGGAEEGVQDSEGWILDQAPTLTTAVCTSPLWASVSPALKESHCTRLVFAKPQAFMSQCHDVSFSHTTYTILLIRYLLSSYTMPVHSRFLRPCHCIACILVGGRKTFSSGGKTQQGTLQGFFSSANSSSSCLPKLILVDHLSRARHHAGIWRFSAELDLVLAQDPWPDGRYGVATVGGEVLSVSTSSPRVSGALALFSAVSPELAQGLC